MICRPTTSTLFPYTTLFRSGLSDAFAATDERIGLRKRDHFRQVLVRQVRQTEDDSRSEEHTSELQSQSNLVCRLLLEKKKQSRALRRLIQQPHMSRKKRAIS